MLQRLEQVFELCAPYLETIHDVHALLGASKSVNSTIHSSLTPSSLLGILLRSPWPDRRTSQWIIFSYIASCFPTLLQDESHRRSYKRSIPNFPQSLFSLAQVHTSFLSACTPSFSLKNVGKTWRKRHEILVSLTDLVDNCVGEQCYAVPDFWDGGREDAATLYAEPSMSVLQMAVYGEMWGGQVGPAYESYLESQRDLGVMGDKTASELENEERTRSSSTSTSYSGGTLKLTKDKYHLPRQLSGCEVSLRVEWVKYAMPDWHTTLPLRKTYHPSGITSSYPSSPVLEASGLVSPISTPSPVDQDEVVQDEVDQDEVEEGGMVVQDDRSDADSPIPPFNPNGPVPIEEHMAALENVDDPLPEPPTYTPSVHPLRQIREAGAYVDHMSGIGWREDHVEVMLHLLQVSPLWARITKRIRQRAIRLALSAPSTPVASSESAENSNANAQKAADSQVEEQMSNGHENHADLDKRVVEEFGTTITDSEWDEPVSWKQILCEDALWTSGWAGLEMIADAWEYDVENVSAAQRRARRASTLDMDRDEDEAEVPASGLGSEDEGRTMRDSRGFEGGVVDINGGGRISNDHPAIQRLMGIYRQLAQMEIEPERVTLKSLTRPRRKGVVGWVGVPCFLGDLRLVGWDDDLGREWEVK